ncbi:MAG: UvrB/UvrC motif-containing protein [Bacteroidaceae bacterium]|nr:UvrB/UvrC motif-containing protein [Bacteroidaceae bacterium]
MRCMAVLITAEEYQLVSKMMRGEIDPFIHTYRDTLDTFGVKLHCVVIHNNTSDGGYCSELIMEQGSDMRHVRQRTGLGVSIAMGLGVPLQANRRYFDETADDAMQPDGTVQVKLPLKAMELTLLREALEEAVQKEQFEIASTLRDEIARRENLSRFSSTATL